MKKIISTILGAAFLLTGCSSGADKEPVVVCHKENYVKATNRYLAARGTFYTCGGPKCVVTETTKEAGKVVLRTTSKKKYPQEFTVAKSVTSWSTSNCGTIYRKRAK